MTTPDSIQAWPSLNDLRYHWDEAYKIDYRPGEPGQPWRAERLDDHQVLTAASPSALRDRIIDDYTLRPVPPAENPLRSQLPPTATRNAG